MSNKFDELTKCIAQSVTRRAALKKFGLGLAGMTLAALLVMPSAAADPKAGTSTIFDAAGDAAFPFDLYDGPAPAYLDVVAASVSYSRGIFHFEIKLNAEIPDNADPGFTPSVNHLGSTFGILTDLKSAGTPFKFLGQTDTYHFNFLLGALYSVTDSGVGLNLGWSGFLTDVSTFTAVAIPMKIKGDTLIIETTADSLGNPASFDWVVGSECDPVPILEEKQRGTVLVDFAPDHGHATWPAQ